MRATRRRSRSTDPLASPDAVRAILQRLRENLPDIIPVSEKQLLKLLEAARHVERRPASDTKRGCPSRFARTELLDVARGLRAVLQCETSGRVSLSSFVGHYLRIPRFPPDIVPALESGDINLQEAAQLARLSADRLDCTPVEAATLRCDVLHAHLMMRGSRNSLRSRVKEILGEVIEVSTENMTAVVRKVDELLEVDPSDKRHIFYEEMKRLFYAMREIEPDDVDDPMLDQFMAAADEMSNILYAIGIKRRQSG